jgi:hypothetical protein
MKGREGRGKMEESKQEVDIKKRKKKERKRRDGKMKEISKDSKKSI